MKKADEDAEIVSDWKFAAMVVDRYVFEVPPTQSFFLLDQSLSINKISLADFVCLCSRYLQLLQH
jgi:hypothetical protein